jgi:hypothetical protein
VFIEGLYTLLAIDPWLLTVEVESAKARLAKGMLRVGLWGIGMRLCGGPRIMTFQVCSLEVLLFFLIKVLHADGRFVLDNIIHVTRVIESIDDPNLDAYDQT